MLSRATQTTFGRLTLLLTTVAAVLLGSAALAHFAFGLFADFGEALWSAVLHLLDPSSLHDDHGGAERAIGVVQAITGLVLLVGVLFTLVAESVGSSIERLGRYEPPIRARDHLLILGGGDRLAGAVGALALALASEFAGDHDRIVVLASESARPSRRSLLAGLREQAAPMRLDLAIGDAGDASGFALGAADEAAAILVLPTGSGRVIAEAADVEVMQISLALRDYLAEHGAEPDVRMLFRRGRNVDAIWELMPDGWDAIVGDRIVASIIRHSLTGLRGAPEIAALIDPSGSGDTDAPRRALERAGSEGRPLRLTMVGCGINTPAVLEDLAEAGAERFALTMLAPRQAFEAYLGRAERAGMALDFEEVSLTDPEQLREALRRSRPEAVVLAPSPSHWDQSDSDAEATMALLHVLRCLGPEIPVVAELFLPASVERLPDDPRLLAISSLRVISAGLALTVFDPKRARELEDALDAAERE